MKQLFIFHFRTPLHLAASIGSVKITEELIKFGACLEEWDFNRKCTPLHCAAAAGDVSTVECLIKAGADVNAGLSGKSPLHYAVQSNAQSCVEALLRAGASPNNPQVIALVFSFVKHEILEFISSSFDW